MVAEGGTCRRGEKQGGGKGGQGDKEIYLFLLLLSLSAFAFPVPFPSLLSFSHILIVFILSAGVFQLFLVFFVNLFSTLLTC